MILWFLGMEAKRIKPPFWDPKGYYVVFEGNEDDFVRKYGEKPTAEKALADIMEWQNQG